MSGKYPKDLALLRYLGRSYQDLAKVLAQEGRRTDAVAASEKAIGTAEAARTVDAGNAVTQSLLPQAYASAGAVYAILAKALGPSAQRREDWIQARDGYQRSVSAWERIQTQAAGPTNWNDQLAKARAEIKRCTAAAAAIR